MKTNDSHPVHVILCDWSKARKAIHVNTVAEKSERIPSLSFLPIKQMNIKCTRQVYILPH